MDMPEDSALPSPHAGSGAAWQPCLRSRARMEVHARRMGTSGAGGARPFGLPDRACTLGGERDLGHEPAWQLGLGADVTFCPKPAALDAAWGNRPVSFQIFLRPRPGDDQKGNKH